MNTENAVRELLTHDGIFAVAISTSSEQTFALADFTVDPAATTTATTNINARLMGLCTATINLHRRNSLKGLSRMMIHEEPFGSISVVTNTVDDVLVAVIVQSGHNVCKSLRRMLMRLIARAKKGKTLHMTTTASVPEAMA